MWECACGVSNRDTRLKCTGCGTPKGMVWTPTGFKTPDLAETVTQTVKQDTSIKAFYKFWPKITDSESARGAARQGFWAAIFVAVVTAVFAVSGFIGMSIGALFDATLFAIIAWGIHKMSRVASVAGLCLYIVESIWRWIEFGPTNIVVAALLVLCFINSVRGTFEYHKIINSRVIVRNVIIVNSLALFYSLAAIIISFFVLISGGYYETMNDELLGLIMISVVLIVYALSLIGLMPFTKNRGIIAKGVERKGGSNDVIHR